MPIFKSAIPNKMGQRDTVWRHGNGLESYASNLNNTVEDASGLENADKKDLMDMIDELFDWMNESPDSSKG